MDKAQSVRLVGDAQRRHAMQLIMHAPVGWVMKLAAETRRDAQNRKMHPMLKDIQQQVPGASLRTTEDIKLQFLNALGHEMRFLPDLDGEGFFPVGHRSSTLTVAQFAGLIELIYAFGAKHNVRWSDPAERIAA